MPEPAGAPSIGCLPPWSWVVITEWEGSPPTLSGLLFVSSHPLPPWRRGCPHLLGNTVTAKGQRPCSPAWKSRDSLHPSFSLARFPMSHMNGCCPRGLAVGHRGRGSRAKRKVDPGQCWPDPVLPPGPLGHPGPLQMELGWVFCDSKGAGPELHSAQVLAKFPLRGQEKQLLPAAQTFSCRPAAPRARPRQRPHLRVLAKRRGLPLAPSCVALSKRRRRPEPTRSLRPLRLQLLAPPTPRAAPRWSSTVPPPGAKPEDATPDEGHGRGGLPEAGRDEETGRQRRAPRWASNLRSPGRRRPARGASRRCPRAAAARPGLGGLWSTSRLPGRAPLSPRPPARRDPHLGHLRPEVDVLEVDGAGGEVVQELTQEDAVAQRLRQVEHHRRGPHDPVVGRQDLAVDEPAAALPPLLHGARGGRTAGPLRAALGPKCGGRGASRPRARGSVAGAGLRAGGPGSPMRRRASSPLPPAPAPRGPPLPPTCSRGVGAARHAGPPHTHGRPRTPGRAPRLPPPQRPAIGPTGRRMLRSGRSAAATAPAPPETKGRWVARSARPGPGPPSPPPLCSPRLRAPHSALGAWTRPRGGSGVAGALGARGARPRAGRGGGGAGARAWHRPRPPHFLPRRPPKLRRAGAAAQPGTRPLRPRGAQTFGELCAWGERPRLWRDGRVSVSALALRSAPWRSGGRPCRSGRFRTALGEGQTQEGAQTGLRTPPRVPSVHQAVPEG